MAKKIISGLSEETINELKTLQINHVKERFSDKDFEQNLLAELKRYKDEIFKLNFADLIDKELVIKSAKETSNPGAIKFFAYPVIKEAVELFVEYVKNNELNTSDLISEKSHEYIEALINTDYTPPKESIKKIVNQKAVREMLVTIIHDAINAFEKKINPVSGLMKSFVNIDKEVKAFLRTFIDSSINKSVDFMVSDSNQKMIREFGVKIFHLALDQSIDEPAKKLPADFWENLIKIAQIQSEFMIDTDIYNFFQTQMIDFAFDKYGQQPISKLAEKSGLTDETIDKWIEELCVELVKYLKSDGAQAFFEKEIELFWNSVQG